MSSTLTIIGSRQFIIDNFQRYYVILDNKEIGTISLQDAVSFKISPGKHKLYIRFDTLVLLSFSYRCSDILIFNVDYDENIIVNFSLKRWTARYKLELLSNDNVLQNDILQIPSNVTSTQSQSVSTVHLSPQVEREQTKFDEVPVPPGVTIKVKRSITVKHTVSVNWGQSGGGNISVGMKHVLSASIRGQIEQKQGRTYQESETIEYEITLDGNKSNKYALFGVDVWRRGNAEIRQNNSTRMVEFKFREIRRLEAFPID